MRERIALIVAAVALASGAAAEPDLHIEECAKLGAAWLKQNPLEKDSGATANTFYNPKTNKCWIVKSGAIHVLRERRLIDAQTGIESMNCNEDFNENSQDKECNYINEVENGNLASGFMAAPLPSALRLPR